jgi:hypothetical protein
MMRHAGLMEEGHVCAWQQSGPGRLQPAVQYLRLGKHAHKATEKKRMHFACLVLLVTALSCMHVKPLRAQVAEAAVGGEQRLSVGGLVSGFHLDYGKRSLGGVGIYVDTDLNPHLGIEGEARWMFLHQENRTKFSTYQVGPRYQFSSIGRLRPYVKVLAGEATFQFPYKYATGNYFVVSPGGGVDYRINHRIRLRLADFEYQYWPDFTYGSMSTYGVSCGVSYGF